MGFLMLSIKNLRRRAFRTGLTLLAIAIGIAMLFSFLSFNEGYQAGLRSELGNMGAHVLAISKGCPYEATAMILHGGTVEDYLDADDVLAIRSMDYVENAVGMFMNQILLGHGKSKVIIGLDPEAFALKPWWEIRGERFSGSETVILPVGMAEELGIGIGDNLSLDNLEREFTVVGLLEQTGSQDDQFIYMPLATAQEIFDAPGKVTSIAIQVSDLSRIQDVVKSVEKLSDVQAITMNQVLGTAQTLMNSAKGMINTIVAIAVVISALGVMNSILMSVFERTREIGMMKAVGASELDVFVLVWVESIMLTLLGGVTGIVMALLGGKLIEGLVRSLLPFAPAGSLMAFDWNLIIVSMVAALTMGLVAGLYPALRASALSPMEAIRSE